ncbi:putative ribonuclease H-like domain-containing protein [Tanacetum coccineum]
MNYKLVVAGNQSNGNAGTKSSNDAGKTRVKTVPGKDYILLPLWTVDSLFSSPPKSSLDDGFKPLGDAEKKDTEDLGNDDDKKISKEAQSDDQEKEDDVNNTNNVNAASINKVNAGGAKTSIELPDDPNMHPLEDIGHTQEEGIEYDEVFSLVARIEAIGLFLAYASYRDFVVYQMDVKSAFLYGKIEEEVYVCQPSGFEDPDFPDRNRKDMCTEFEKMMHKKFQMSFMGELTFFLGLQVKQKEDGIFISQDKYVTEILKKFGFSDVKTASTPIETHKPLLKDADREDTDEHLYRSMIGSLMYLTSSRPDIMFAVCACARFQVNPKISYLHAVKRIFRYLKGQPNLGLWYPKDSPFDLVAYTDSDYAGASLDRKSTTGGCQFLGCRLISWQCKKQTVVANSTTKAEYIVASNCCGQVFWIQNQMLDYGYNFMHTKIYIANESTICIVKNPVFHSKIKHIEIRHHFIKYSNEKLIQIIKIHTDQNVLDLLTKAFDVSIFQYLIASIGMLNL